MILIPSRPLPNTESRIAITAGHAQSVASLLGLRVKKKTYSTGTFCFLERKLGNINWTCSFDDTSFKICAENKVLGRLPVTIFAAFKVKSNRISFPTEYFELSQALGMPFFSRDQFIAKTKDFVLKNEFINILRTIDFVPVRSLNFTETQLLSSSAFSHAQACADLLLATEKIMQLLHLQRLPEIEKLLATQGVKVRKPYVKITAKDLTTYPAWEFASDEEGVEGQDETTVRPCLDSAVPRGEGCYLLRTMFVLADGTHAKGFLTAVDDLGHYNLMAPTICVGTRQISLVLGRNQDEEDKWKKWKKKPKSVFPLHFSTDIAYDGKYIVAKVDAFMTEEMWKEQPQPARFMDISAPNQ